MKALRYKEQDADRLHMAASYLEIDEDNFLMRRGNYHPYCELAAEYKEDLRPEEVLRKPSMLKRLFHTVF